MNREIFRVGIVIAAIACLSIGGCKKKESLEGGNRKSIKLGQTVEFGGTNEQNRFSIRFHRAWVTSGPLPIKFRQDSFSSLDKPKEGNTCAIVLAEVRNLGPRAGFVSNLLTEFETSKGYIYRGAYTEEVRGPHQGDWVKKSTDNPWEPETTTWWMACGEVPADAAPVAMLVEVPSVTVGKNNYERLHLRLEFGSLLAEQQKQLNEFEHRRKAQPIVLP